MEILKNVTIILFIAVILYLFMIMPRMIHRPDKTPFMGYLYAHRGLHDNGTETPENSLEAFRKAVEAGFGIELDVQISKDRVPVVFHDFSLQRICGVKGKLEDYTYEELKQLRLFGTSAGIPRLEDVLTLVDGRVPLIVEYKIPGRHTEICYIADKLLSVYKGPYCIESFNPLGLLWYRKNRRNVMRGQLSDNFIKVGEKELPKRMYFSMQHLLLNFLTKPDFIAYNHNYYMDLSRRLCRYLYRTVSVAWTIRNEDELNARRGDFDLFIFDGFIPI
jgi:glycerophosphoryl diester phosphodiesterase